MFSCRLLSVSISFGLCQVFLVWSEITQRDSHTPEQHNEAMFLTRIPRKSVANICPTYLPNSEPAYFFVLIAHAICGGFEAIEFDCVKHSPHGDV